MFVVFFLDFPAPGAREAGPDKPVDQIERKKGRQDVIKNFLLQNEHGADKDGRADGLGKCAGGAQAQRFKARIAHGAHHHGREKNQDGGDHIISTLPGVFPFVLKCMMSSVSEATRPAAEGMGKPRKSLPVPLAPIVARQLNRASRNAPHSK